MFRISAIAIAVVGSAAFFFLNAADGDLTVAKAKRLISDAAGMPAEELRTLAQAQDQAKFQPKNGDTLTWVVLNYAPGADTPKNPTSFKFLEETINPAKLASAISGPKDMLGKFRSTATVIQPEYITDCTCKIDGDTATGTVSFKAEKLYEGKIDYTAKKKGGTWRIEEFQLPDLKLTIALGADGKWSKK